MGNETYHYPKDRSVMIDPTDQLAVLGIKVSTMIAGFSGGLVFAYLEGTKKINESRGKRILDSITSGIIGSIMAVYIAPLGLLWFRVSEDALEIQTGAGFITGMTGIYIGHGLIRIAAGWSKNPTLPGRE